jgi:tripartite-type tricarboxylate transporter receptor subunit TctC
LYASRHKTCWKKLIQLNKNGDEMKKQTLNSALKFFSAVCTSALLTCFSGGGALAQAPAAYPSKPVKVIVPFGPGSATDIGARTISEELRAALGATFIVDNRAGANGFIAAEAAAKSAPDGYTLFVTASTTHTTNPYLFKKLPYDPVKDFTPVGGVFEAYYVLLVNKDLPVNSLSELVSWLKANPTAGSYAWGATVSQITGASFLKRVGVEAVGIPYKSSPQAISDLIGGQFTFIFNDITTALAHIKGGRVKALAVSSPARIPQLPNVPTLMEAGIANFDAATWVGVMVPAGTPAPIVAQLSTTLQNILKKPSVIQRMESCCSVRLFPAMTPAEFSDYLTQDRNAWAIKIKAAGIQPE